MPPQIAASRLDAPPLGQLLREWRARRRLSQLELSLQSGVSARHVSYVETGRARPSRELLETLADALDVPSRERNAIMLAAGFAPQFAENDLDARHLALMRQAIEVTLSHQEPYPAFVTDRCWNVLMANAGMDRLLSAIRPCGPRHGNIVRQVFDPEDMRPFIENWEDVAGDLLRHLRHEVVRRPSDGAARQLLQEALAYPGVAAQLSVGPGDPGPAPVLTTVFRNGPLRLSFFSTLTRFAGASELILEEVTIECMHPADETTRAYFRSPI